MMVQYLAKRIVEGANRPHSKETSLEKRGPSWHAIDDDRLIEMVFLNFALSLNRLASRCCSGHHIRL